MLMEIEFLNSFRFATSQELRTKLYLKSVTRKYIRNTKSVFGIYRCFQLMNQEFNSCMSQVVAWLQLMMLVIPASANFVMIRAHTEVQVLALLGVVGVSVSIILIVVLILPFGGSVYSNSVTCLGSWKGIMCKRQLRGCRPLRIQIGDILFIQPFTVLRTIGLIIYWTVRSTLIFT